VLLLVGEAIRLRPCRGLRRYPINSATRLPNGVRGRITPLRRMCILAFRQRRARRGRRQEPPTRSSQMLRSGRYILFLDLRLRKQDRSFTLASSARRPSTPPFIRLVRERAQARAKATQASQFTQATRGRCPLSRHILRRRTIPFPTFSTARRRNHRGRRKDMWRPHACLARRPISGLSLRS
jgi:hypothetical protein